MKISKGDPPKNFAGTAGKKFKIHFAKIFRKGQNLGQIAKFGANCKILRIFLQNLLFSTKSFGPICITSLKTCRSVEDTYVETQAEQGQLNSTGPHHKKNVWRTFRKFSDQQNFRRVVNPVANGRLVKVSLK